MAITAAVLAPSAPPAVALPDAPSPLHLRVLSSRADLVSGGDALVEVVVAPEASTEVTIRVDGRDVSASFARIGAGRLLGVVTALEIGPQTLEARLGDGSRARLELTNHPVGGPIFAGPQVQPWPCATERYGLGPALDEQCNAATVYDFFYRSTSSDEFEPYDPAAPPASEEIQQTTTDHGVTVPYVVRRERGVIDRGIYDIAVLYDPEVPWTPWAPQRAWNGKLYWPFGGSCQPYHGQVAPGDRPDIGGGDTPGVLDHNALSRGFAVASSGFSVLGNNCSTIVSAEALMMVKEHLIEQYGPVRYTMGFGGSGGSIQQIQIAGAYPGLLDGLLLEGTFPDLLTTANENLDCRLLVRYFDETSPALAWSPSARQAVQGHASAATCEAWVSAYGFPAMLADPTLGCRTPLLTYSELHHVGTLRTVEEPDWVYDPVSNRQGVRCTIYDYMRAVFGQRDDGFARRPYDNVGVQYGLRALLAGAILPEQFVDLNEKIGGLDIDYRHQGERTAADAGAVAAAYRSGQVSHGGHLDTVAIVDGTVSGAFDLEYGDIHTPFHSWSLRERLVAANGHADNAVIRQHEDVITRFDLLDAWLTAVEADEGPGTVADKIVRQRPAAAVDRGTYRGTNPRVAAGAPLRNDVLKCELRAPRRSDYDDLVVPLSDDQWERLKRAFPHGVCDWSRPGVDQQETVAWAAYGRADLTALRGESPTPR